MTTARAALDPAVNGSDLVVLAVLALVLGAIVWLGVVGSDAFWLSALGGFIRAEGRVPHGVPFAAADTGQWVNTTVVGQLLFSLAAQLGSLGILLAQLIAVGFTLGTIAKSALTRGATPVATAAVIGLVAIGAAAPLLIARAQLLSLLPYALLLTILRSQHLQPDGRIWWAVPVIAVWGNLHGAVLVGIAVLGVYLILSRLLLTPLTALGVGALSLAATCLNPGFLDSPRYYADVFSGQATSDDTGMWSRLDLANPLDVLLVLAAGVLVAAGLRRRWPIWEYAAVLGLLVATVSAARHGIWLLLFLAVPAALGIHPAVNAVRSRISSRALPLGVTVLLLVCCTALVTIREPSLTAFDAEAKQIAAATRGRVVLASEPLAESLAAAGTTVWASNPLDAFQPSDQSAYLAFLKGDGAGARRALEQADVVIALPDSPQTRIATLTGYTEVDAVGRFIVLRRLR